MPIMTAPLMNDRRSDTRSEASRMLRKRPRREEVRTKETHHRITIVDNWFRHPTLRMIKLDGSSKMTVRGRAISAAQKIAEGKKSGLTVRNEEDESDDRVALADRELQVLSHAGKASTAREKGWSARGRWTPPQQREAAPNRLFFQRAGKSRKNPRTLKYWSYL